MLRLLSLYSLGSNVVLEDTVGNRLIDRTIGKATKYNIYQSGLSVGESKMRLLVD